jgi:hypothetical protein
MKAFRRQLRHCLHTRNQNAISSFNAHQRKELEAVLSGMQDNVK